ncbi:uncharacterized protein LOC119386652 [Rhipicephalus sanguineus]|uniref:uncharacterized protein LOC119386652 n=1 Tax=Rhipicephalus sanguineus TaxID=34632 RepID=UPI00189615AA|nr:uncharacterized protein LOC119386652 [Rhipicephalus sanguineus]
MRACFVIVLLPYLIATLERACAKPTLSAHLADHHSGHVTGHHDAIIYQLGHEDPHRGALLHLASIHGHDVHGNGHEAAVLAGAAGISPHDHTEHHQGVHYEDGAYGCPLLGFICKHHCLSSGHGSGYCGGPHLGRCICPIW